MKKNDDTKNISYEKMAEYAAILGLTEIGLGSFLHSLKIPFSGHALSLNQALILTYAKLKLISTNHKHSSFLIANSTALLKSLSPAGKKLTPMLAISTQGNVHGFTTLLLGTNFFSLMLANIGLGLWAFIQPVLIYFVLFGKDLIFMVNYFIKKISKAFPITEETLVATMGFIIAIKIALCIIITLLAFKLREEDFKKYIDKLNRYRPKRVKTTSILKGVLKDITRPIFIISFLLMGIFYFNAKNDLSLSIWQLLRPFGSAIIIFYLIRKLSFSWLLNKLINSKVSGLGHVLKSAIEKIKS